MFAIPMEEEIPHTLSEFDALLESTREQVLLMASTASENLKNAVSGLLDRDEDLCKKARRDDSEVNQYERDIGEEGMEILVRFNPVATDLRVVVGSIKIATNLERISDEAGNIAKRGGKIIRQKEIPRTRQIESLYTVATGLLEDAIRSYSEGNVDLALALYRRDKELDEMHSRLIKRLTREMEEDVENLRTYLNLIYVVRALERIGDHAVNIGEEVVYIHRAADIRHVGPAALEEE